MPPKKHVKSKPYWLVTLPRGDLEASRDVTWGDVKACIAALNMAHGDVFAGLHRCEGGFMCVEGPGFKSEDRVDSGLPHQNPMRLSPSPNKIVHKEIRFGGRPLMSGGRWPSRNGSFLGNDLLTDDWIVMERGHETHLQFQGEHCVPWTREQCNMYARVVEQTLGLESAMPCKRRRTHP